MTAKYASVPMLQLVTKGINRTTVTNSYMNVTKAQREAKEKLIQERGGVCQRCGVAPDGMPKTQLHVHHIIQRKQGGTADPINLQIVCASCHARLGTGLIIRIRPDILAWLKTIDSSPTKALDALRSNYKSNAEVAEMLREIKEHILSR